MLLKYLPVAVVATAFSFTFAHAQGRAPAELPPAGYAGQQYVDSRGCLFIRAGHGGQVNWVARIDGARKPICGQPPSTAVMASAKRELAAPVAVAAAPVAAPGPVPAPRVAARPGGQVPTASYLPPPVSYGAPRPLQPTPRVAAAAPSLSPAPQPTVFGQASAPAPALALTPAPQPTVFARSTGPVLTPAPQPTVFSQAVPASDVRAQTAQVAALPSRTTGCPDHAPVGQVYPLHRGGSLLVCASGAHRLTGLRQGDVERFAQARGVAAAQPVQMAETDLMAPPAGFKPAWRDDRLNPNRARGTQQGHGQMLQVWTGKVPQQLRDPAYAQPRRVAASSKSVPVARQVAPVSGARFVQVGSFGVPDNAARAVVRLQSLGLPVQVSRAQIKGKPVQVVRAGPFASEGQAVSALQAARGAGFADAILRR